MFHDVRLVSLIGPLPSRNEHSAIHPYCHFSHRRDSCSLALGSKLREQNAMPFYRMACSTEQAPEVTSEAFQLAFIGQSALKGVLHL